MHAHFFINTHKHGCKESRSGLGSSVIRVRDRGTCWLIATCRCSIAQRRQTTRHTNTGPCMLNSCGGTAEERLTSLAAVSSEQTTRSETCCKHRQINSTVRQTNSNTSAITLSRNVFPKRLKPEMCCLIMVPKITS